MGIPKRLKSGFTIVELAVIISIIGILASITIVGYGVWQKRTIENVVKTDLKNAVAAMENGRNFSNGYPLTVPSSFKASDKVALIGGGSADRTSFCVQAASTQDTSVIMYVTDTSTTPQTGNCTESSGLVAWWSMNGNGNDTSGNGNNGTVYNATSAVGQNGGTASAYTFNGTTAYIDAGTNTILTFTDNFTLSAWIRPTSYHTTGYYGMKNGVIARGPASTYNYVLQVTNNTTISFIKRTGAEGLQFYNFAGIPSLTNKWSLATLTVKSGTASLYIDGTLFGSTAVGAIAGVTNDRLYIGSAAGSNVECLFIGSIDDARVYNRALSASEVQAVFSAGAQ